MILTVGDPDTVFEQAIAAGATEVGAIFEGRDFSQPFQREALHALVSRLGKMGENRSCLNSRSTDSLIRGEAT